MSHDEVLKVEIDNLKSDMQEVKSELKEQKNSYSETIVVMRENLTRLTILMEKQEEQLSKQDQRLEKQDVRLDKQEQTLAVIGQEVSYLRKSIDAHVSDFDEPENVKWYQKIIEGNGKLIAIVLIVLICAFTGYKLEDIIGFLK